MNDTPEIKAIIFDYGGVISQEGYLGTFSDMYAEEFKKDPKELAETVTREWLAVRENQEPSNRFWERVASYIGTKPETFREDLLLYSGFRFDVYQFIKNLKTSGYKLAILSNQIEDWLEQVRTEKKFDEVFDAFITSYNVKAAKPNQKIYLKAIEGLGIPSHQCVFIDDMEKNLIPAQHMGMRTILFQNLEQLKKDLSDLGVRTKDHMPPLGIEPRSAA